MTTATSAVARHGNSTHMFKLLHLLAILVLGGIQYFTPHLRTHKFPPKMRDTMYHLSTHSSSYYNWLICGRDSPYRLAWGYFPFWNKHQLAYYAQVPLPNSLTAFCIDLHNCKCLCADWKVPFEESQHNARATMKGETSCPHACMTAHKSDELKCEWLAIAGPPEWFKCFLCNARLLHTPKVPVCLVRPSRLNTQALRVRQPDGTV